MTELELPSNSGNESIRFRVAETARTLAEPLVVADVVVRGVHRDGDHEQPVELSASEVPLLLRGFKEGLESLEVWLDLPLSRLAETPLETVLDLGTHLSIGFGQRASETSEGHPVATVRCAFGGLRGEFSLLADQSCLQIFCDGIRGLVR